MKCLLIVNPVAGTLKIKNDLLAIIEVLSSRGYTPTVVPTSPDGKTPEYVEKNAEGYDLIMCCGGDGTLNEVIRGLLKIEKEKRPELLYYACGSTNDFATTMGLPKTVEGLGKALDKHKILNLDVGMVNGEINFCYIASFGIFTKASYSADRKVKNAIGHLAYILKAMEELGTLGKSYHTKVTYDEGEIEGDYVLVGVTNSTSAGGVLRLSEKEVSLSDGLFEILLIKGLSNPATTVSVADKLLRQEYDGDNIILLHSSSVKIECSDNPPWTTDGEYAGEIGVADIKCLHGAVSVIV